MHAITPFRETLTLALAPFGAPQSADTYGGVQGGGRDESRSILEVASGLRFVTVVQPESFLLGKTVV